MSKPKRDAEKVKEYILSHKEITDKGCWEWRGYVDAKGYGQMEYGGKRKRVHQFAYEIFKGKVTPGKKLMRICENEKCINPDHREERTQGEIVQRNHRYARGEKHPFAKMTREGALEARRMRGEGKSYKEIALYFGRSVGAIQAILAERTWKEEEKASQERPSEGS